MNYLSDYQTFSNKSELNEAISAHISAHTYDLNDTARDVLLMLARYAVKYPGVAHLKTATIAEVIRKTGRTIRRAIARLIELGIIEKLPFMREVSGGFGANIYRILPYDVQSELSSRKDAVEPTETSVEPSENGNEPISSFNQKDLINNTYYARFKAFIQSTIGEGNQPLISRLFGVYKAHSTPLLRGQAFDKQSVEQAGWQALKAAVMATKSKNIRNIAGYYSGVLDRMLDRLYFEEMEGLGKILEFLV
ncbi:helix-turn-helix domain-containing protein [Lederbergia citri]|uniref:Helix-turn-helix domain-containing protein n=1 Tax=Lederbergia citri TaxID=2833580 RepID=A0A942T946_9BACI|nr:helix-turn-helix domain-containing protein [Lederbergia citri]MBS4193465.1 helix-turn-helix domain-containing protein [Lederbergia citri]